MWHEWKFSVIRHFRGGRISLRPNGFGNLPMSTDLRFFETEFASFMEIAENCFKQIIGDLFERRSAIIAFVCVTLKLFIYKLLQEKDWVTPLDALSLFVSKGNSRETRTVRWVDYSMLQFHGQPHCLRARSYLCPFKWNKKPLNHRRQLDEMICIIPTLAGYRFLRKWQDNIHSDGILPSNDVDRENGRSSIRGRHRNGSCHAKTRSVQTCGDCSFSA